MYITKNQTVGTQSNETIKTKSEILFLYESTYSIPNGDPFTGEQRYDEETKRVLVSDVRIKRFIRDYLVDNKHEIYVVSDKSCVSEEGAETGAAARFKALQEKYKDIKEPAQVLLKCIDARLFGGLVTIKKTKGKKKIEKEQEETDNTAAFNLTGPIQFALLNPSLNEVDLRMHQNTSVFVSKMEYSRGAIGTTTVVPYCINQIHGWINPYSARHTGLTETDVSLMFKALWESINSANTRTKSNQNSLLLLQIVYSEPTKKLYGLDRLIKLNSKDNKRGEQLRSIEDYEFDFTNLINAANSNVVSSVNFYCELPNIKSAFANNNKFRGMTI
jgi:CRISPR-associated protein Csh2